MKRVFFLVACAALPLVACNSKQSENDNQVVDTTLNDPAAARSQRADTMNVDENLTVESPAVASESRYYAPQDVQQRSVVVDDHNFTHAPSARRVQAAQSAAGDLRTLFSADDYPAAAQAAGAEGTAQAELTVGPDGRVVVCNLTRSTGNGALNSATCNILRRRAVFTPARDSNGEPTTDVVTTPPIAWRLEG